MEVDTKKVLTSDDKLLRILEGAVHMLVRIITWTFRYYNSVSNPALTPCASLSGIVRHCATNVQDCLVCHGAVLSMTQFSRHAAQELALHDNGKGCRKRSQVPNQHRLEVRHL